MVKRTDFFHSANLLFFVRNSEIKPCKNFHAALDGCLYFFSWQRSTFATLNNLHASSHSEKFWPPSQFCRQSLRCVICFVIVNAIKQLKFRWIKTSNKDEGLTQLSVNLAMREIDYQLITQKRVRIFRLFTYGETSITRWYHMLKPPFFLTNAYY